MVDADFDTACKEGNRVESERWSQLAERSRKSGDFVLEFYRP